MNKKLLTVNSIMFIAPLIGGASMLLFMVFLLTGSLYIVQMGLPEIGVLAWNAILSLVFFIQHSGMIRRSFRTRLSTKIPAHFNDAIYAIASSIVLITVVVLWQPSTIVLYELDGFARWIARSFFFLTIAGLGWGVYALKHFDAFGSKPIRDHLEGKQNPPQQLSVYGPYRWVRHPLYFFVLLLIWSCPDLTLDRLLFNFLWTLWIIFATVLEEKDLLSDFGDDYRQYQDSVPMLLPWKGRCSRFNSKWRINHGS